LKIGDKNGDRGGSQSKSKSTTHIAFAKIILATIQITLGSPAVQNNSHRTVRVAFLWSIMGKLNFDFMNYIPISCYTQFRYLNSMYYSSLLPICFVGLLITSYVIQLTLDRVCFRYTHQQQRDRRERYQQFYVTVFFYVTYCCLEPVVNKVFRTFACTNIDPLNESKIYSIQHGSTSRLTADYSVDCKSDFYYYYYYWAVGMIVVYVLVIPGLYSLLLYAYKDVIVNRHNEKLMRSLRGDFHRRRKKFVRMIGFIYVMYMPKYWYWEVKRYMK
jgi:hypothetical protein